MPNGQFVKRQRNRSHLYSDPVSINRFSNMTYDFNDTLARVICQENAAARRK
ncbi:hypothetical protein ANACOL_02430 [Anaerotruncus colihominis DSM 17241]|uniref:Uncharacterized protein n=1 Tax=Anaerotruncus colihominis DSM 17241 TaxID=445972 RepID=B0PCC2_9FIRM|nr:hypothetical protein ANACOL_02430 [Anaerotruncus colihominis DSM 17241]